MTNPLLVPDLTKAIREAQELKPEEPAAEVDETASECPAEPEETEEEAARKDKMHRVPNRQQTRHLLNQRGEEQSLRPRIRRRIYAQRRKHDAK
ncbi:hypothetical protein [Mycobacterium sp. AZCC_0083]|uniref:hypothetical protein n=1 Tax=Mycobacterium sp. AZCC_0083 TaxID=2735882 RepID=UPI001619ED0F|nr:hypothetical protein [Mycobacterium sp. AZCC_0083]MBB5167144.1 hypothetical protein [Mycobacterium sp. AZCC_0083]